MSECVYDVSQWRLPPGRVYTIDCCHLLAILLVTQTQQPPEYFLHGLGCKNICNPQDGSSWSHVSGQNVGLQNSTLLHLLEIERVYLQKQAQVNIRAEIDS